MSRPYAPTGSLIDEVAKTDQPRDTALDETRRAARDVAHSERRQAYLEEFGAEGISRANEWSDQITQHGPKAALHAASLYAIQPRPAQPKEEQRDDGDHMAAARSAYRATVAKEAHAGDRHQARAGLDRFEQGWGTLDALDNFKRWDQLLREDPAGNGPRIAQEIHQGLSDAVAQQQANKSLAEYQSKHRISNDEHAIMYRLLRQGLAKDLPSAHAQARHELAGDVEDQVRGYSRDVASVVRQLEAPAEINARAQVDEFRRSHPEVQPGTAINERMKRLLQSETVQTMDEAYKLAKRMRG